MEPDASFLEEPRRLHDVVTDVVRSAIRDRQLTPGALLRAAVLAEAFEVSRVSSTRALVALEAEGLVVRQSGGGFGVGAAPAADAVDAAALQGLISEETRRVIRFRSWRERIYPQIERDVAGCLLFGCFQIRSQALAEHHGVSRTVANEIITRLERVGIVRREANGRWYAGPLTRDRVADLFEMRILLEPTALIQAAPSVSAGDLAAMLDRVRRGIEQGRGVDPMLLHRLEIDLHHDIVLRCRNGDMRDALYRHQLPLIAIHLAFAPDQDRAEIPPMLDAHLAVLTLIAERRWLAAASALAAHLRQSAEVAPERLQRLEPTVASIPPYLTRLR